MKGPPTHPELPVSRNTKQNNVLRLGGSGRFKGRLLAVQASFTVTSLLLLSRRPSSSLASSASRVAVRTGDVSRQRQGPTHRASGTVRREDRRRVRRTKALMGFSDLDTKTPLLASGVFVFRRTPVSVE